jgi:hypothetical protein
LLFLQQRQRVKGAAFWLAAVFLLWGMVMTQSRTGWLQVGLLVAWGLALRARAGLGIARRQLLALGAVFAAGVLAWPVVCNALLLSAERSLGDQMQAGVRLPYWRAMLDAIGREPLWGYGWQQAGAAQQRVALDHPIIGHFFEHSHNLVLDLLLWNGIPAGGLVVLLLAWWLAAQIRACRDGRSAWLLAAIGGLIVHGLLEYPLEYAYFLIPLGLAMGAVEVISPTRSPSLRVPRKVLLGLGLSIGVVFAAVGSEYLQAEENYRTQRMELAHIGIDRLVTPAPHLPLLTQLEARLQVAHIDPKPGMPPEQVELLRRVALRYGFVPMLRRYAMALALNGQPEPAAHQIELVRRIWGESAYDEARAQFKGILDLPNEKPEVSQLP